MKWSHAALLIVILSTSSALPIEFRWEQWKKQHARTYLNGKEELIKKVTWAKNVKFVEDFNQEKHHFSLSTNHFADIVSESIIHIIGSNQKYYCIIQSPEEFQGRLSSIDLSLLQDGASYTYSNSSRCNDECISLDWRNEGFTPEARTAS